MNFKEKELIIFDFDGTLINSIPDLTLNLNIILKGYNLPPLTIKETTPFIGNGALLLVKRALEFSLPSEQITNNLIQKAYNDYLEVYKKNYCIETYLYDGVLETLEYLKKQGYKMAICTNKPFQYIEPILIKLGIDHYFTKWIGEDSLPEKKPKGTPLQYLAKEHNLEFNQCIMIGDSKNDILAAQNAEMDSIGLSYGYNYNENIADFNPTIVKDNFSGLKDLF